MPGSPSGSNDAGNDDAESFPETQPLSRVASVPEILFQSQRDEQEGDSKHGKENKSLKEFLRQVVDRYSSSSVEQRLALVESAGNRASGKGIEGSEESDSSSDNDEGRRQRPAAVTSSSSGKRASGSREGTTASSSKNSSPQSESNPKPSAKGRFSSNQDDSEEKDDDEKKPSARMAAPLADVGKKSYRKRKASLPLSSNAAEAPSFKNFDEDTEKSATKRELEQKRMRERLNGRRKRAKKIVVIDCLNEQYHNLASENNRLRRENDEIRKKIVAVKAMMQQQQQQTQRSLASDPSSAFSIFTALQQQQQNSAATGTQMNPFLSALSNLSVCGTIASNQSSQSQEQHPFPQQSQLAVLQQLFGSGNLTTSMLSPQPQPQSQMGTLAQMLHRSAPANPDISALLTQLPLENSTRNAGTSSSSTQDSNATAASIATTYPDLINALAVTIGAAQLQQQPQPQQSYYSPPQQLQPQPQIQSQQLQQLLQLMNSNTYAPGDSNASNTLT